MVMDSQDPLVAALSAAMPGSGNLARPAEDEDVSSMVAETFRLARQFSANNWPILRPSRYPRARQGRAALAALAGR
jgi:hypothetical protein